MRVSSSPVGCGFFGRSVGGSIVLQVHLVLSYSFTRFSSGFCGAVSGHCLRGRYVCDFYSAKSGDGFVYLVVAFGMHTCFHPGNIGDDPFLSIAALY